MQKINSDMASHSQVKPHAVLTPAPLQAHMISMLKLARVLHHKGFHITYVNTEFNHKCLLKSRGPNALDGLPDFRFETIPDGLPLNSDDDSIQDTPCLSESIDRSCLPFQKLLARLNNESSSSNNGAGIPPVSCLVSDAHVTFTIKAAQEPGIPILLYWPASTCAYLSVAHARTLADTGLIPLKDKNYLTNGYMDTKIDWIPGMKNMRLKDLPSFFRTTDPNDFMMKFIISEVERVPGANAIAFNTFDELEGNAVNALSSMSFSPLYTIGPINLLLDQIPQNDLSSIGINFWREDDECLEWLESKKPKSVIFVSFGSSTVMSEEQLHEFAWGLANSKKPFLWIVRPDLVNGGSMLLSSEFVKETKDRSLIASWCPQEKVLNHPSIGGFLTHCGWNSMIESISAGVPMLCWPYFADQLPNCRFACTEWGIGMEIHSDVKKEEVEKMVNELMAGEKGKRMKEKMMEWKRKAEEDTKPGGSSYINLDKIINEVLLKQYH